jgi:hypothetical protein
MKRRESEETEVATYCLILATRYKSMGIPYDVLAVLPYIDRAIS